MGKRKLALLLTLAMIISMFPTNAFATGFSDMPNDWSTKALENAVSNKLLKGDNGKIIPEDSLTRAQMATIVNRAFGTIEKSSIDDFKDVKKDAWYYDEMSKAVQMKTFIGSGVNLYPDNNITREEAFVVLARAFKLSGSNDNIFDKFSDKNSVSDWARDGVSSLVNAGYISGSNGQINPKQNITRAEFAQMMDNLVKNYINVDGTYTTDYSGNLMINVPNVTLKDLTVTGDLIIGDGVGDGNVTLDNVTVTGRVLVRGGGENSIKIIGNSNIQNIIIARIDGKVRVFAEDGSEIGEVIVDGNDDIIIEGNIGTITIVAPDVTITATNANIESVSMEGSNSNFIIGETSTVNTINVNAEKANVQVSGNVTNINTSNQAQNAEINVAAGAKVENVTVNGQGATIKGEGEVKNVTTNANNVAVSTPNTSVTAALGTTGVTAGEEKVEPGKTVTVPKETPAGDNNGGGGGDNPPVDDNVEVKEITVTPTAISLKVGEEVKLTATVFPANATNKAVTWKTNSADVATVDESGKVTAVSTGTAIITVATVDGNKPATCTVIVGDVIPEPVPVSAITITGNAVVGQTLTATPTPADATGTYQWQYNPGDDKWYDDEDVTSNSYELKVAKKLIRVIFTASGNYSGTVTSEVVGPVAAKDVAVSAISVDEPFLLVKADENELTDVRTIKAIVSPASASNKRVTWSSDNEEVATVDENGVVTGIKGGTATITVTSVADSSKKATVHVVVGDILVPAHFANPDEEGTLQSVIDAAPERSVIAVAPGTYNESITIDRSLTLLGPNADIAGTGVRNAEAVITYPDELESTNDKSLVYITADDVVIKGLSFITEAEEEGSQVREIWFTGYDNEFSNNRVISFNDKVAVHFGIADSYKEDNTRYFNDITDNNGTIVKDNYIKSTSSWSALYLQGRAGIVEGNTIDGGLNAIQIQPYWNGGNGTVRNNKFYGYDRGIWHNRADFGSGSWIYEDNYVYSKLPTNVYRVNPKRWMGIAVQSHGTEGWGGNQPTGDGTLPELAFINNVVDGIAAIDNSEWDEVVGAYFFNNVSNLAEYDFEDNTFANVDTSVWVADGIANLELLDVFDSNNFPDGFNVLGNQIKMPEDGTIYNQNSGIIYNTIQAAVNEAEAGDTILVNGEFEGFTVNKAVTIKGGTINSTTIPATSGNIGVYIPANVTGVVFNGVKIAGVGENPRIGIEVGANAELTVKGSEITDFPTGIYLNPGSELTATGNTISNALAGIGSEKANLTGNISGNTFEVCTSEGIGLYLPIKADGAVMSKQEAEALAVALGNANTFTDCTEEAVKIYGDPVEETGIEGLDAEGNRVGFFDTIAEALANTDVETIVLTEEVDGLKVVSVRKLVSYETEGEVTDIAPEGITFVEGYFLVPPDVIEFTFKDGDRDMLPWYDAAEWHFRELVAYEANGDVMDIDPDTVTYREQERKFLVPEGVTEFTFKDDGGKKKATFAGDKWTIALLVLSNYRLDWSADPNIGYYKITGEIEALDQYENTFDLNGTKNCTFTVSTAHGSVSKPGTVTFSNGKASFELTGAATNYITGLTIEIDGVQY